MPEVGRKNIGQLRESGLVVQVEVDCRLERGEDGRDTLNFVEDRPLRQVPDKPHRIFLGGRAEHVIIEVEVPVATFPTDRLRQRRLAGLARTMDQHGGTVVEGFDEP